MLKGGCVMPKEVRITILTRYRVRYKKATKKERSKILDEFCTTWDYSRKHAIKILNQSLDERKLKPGPRKTYNQSVVIHLVEIWKLTGKICSKRLKAAIPLWLPYYRDSKCDTEIEKLLLMMSCSTIDRLLKPYRGNATKGLSSTTPGTYLKSKIPMEILDTKVKKPGTVQADTVVHCGTSLIGKYANSLTITDLYSGWTENRATWTKASLEVLEQIRDIRKTLPFYVHRFSCDNGSEFINESLVKYFEQHKDPGQPSIKFTRTRPYKKNDNAHVEQKNDSHVRQLFGYHRYDHEELVYLMNDIYKNYWNPLQNFFLPNQKLIKKERIGGRIKKVYDTPKTPFQRIIDCENYPEERRVSLLLTKDGLNPIQLQTILKEKLALFFSTYRKLKATIVEEDLKSA